MLEILDMVCPVLVAAICIHTQVWANETAKETQFTQYFMCACLCVGGMCTWRPEDNLGCYISGVVHLVFLRWGSHSLT